MDLKTATEILAYFQEWRRGADTEQPNPTVLGIAIDTILDHLKNA